MLQDADRLDARGAIGIARCLMLGGAMERPLYGPEGPSLAICATDDSSNVLDHFYLKLLRLAEMTTQAGLSEARPGQPLCATTFGNSAGR